MVHRNQLQRLIEQQLHASLGEDTADQFDMLLRGSDCRGHGSAGRRLKRVSVKAGSGLADTSTVLAQFVHVGQHRECGLADKRLVERLHHTRRAHPDDATDFGVHNVFEVDLALNNCGARVDRLRQAVQHIPEDVGLDELNVHHNVGD